MRANCFLFGEYARLLFCVFATVNRRSDQEGSAVGRGRGNHPRGALCVFFGEGVCLLPRG